MKAIKYHALRNSDNGFEQIIVTRCDGEITDVECERLQGFPDGWTDKHVRYHKTWKAAHSAMDSDNKAMWAEQK